MREAARRQNENHVWFVITLGGLPSWAGQEDQFLRCCAVVAFCALSNWKHLVFVLLR
jgi:hypothetical protein